MEDDGSDLSGYSAYTQGGWLDAEEVAPWVKPSFEALQEKWGLTEDEVARMKSFWVEGLAGGVREEEFMDDDSSDGSDISLHGSSFALMDLDTEDIVESLAAVIAGVDVPPET